MGLPLNQEQIIDTLSELGQRLKNLDEDSLESLSLRSINENPWFTEKNVEAAIKGVIHLLGRDSLEQWASTVSPAITHSRIGLVMAGNIPLVGFHDLLAVWVTGNTAVVKLSSKDSVLVHFVLNTLLEINPDFDKHFIVTDKLKDIDAVIATGSDNSARYFEYYFKKYPHIIRKNRSSVAVLSGNEDVEDLQKLGEDIFTYFGLGCRNVSKLYVPQGYNFQKFYEAIQPFQKVLHHHKYNNNYDYNKSVLLVNHVKHLDNGFLLLQPSADLVSPISVVYYEEYESDTALTELLQMHEEKIQCVVGKGKIPFGQAQQPSLWDYADGVNTLQFLSKIVK